jgi:two-component SAPR family response regulator
MGSVLYSVDELNECAFYYIINSYLRLGDESSAKKHYNSYILRYKKLQGEDYSTLYPELIKIAAKYLKNVK